MAAAHAGARLRRRAGEAAGGARIQHQFRARSDVAQHVADAAQPRRAEVGTEGRRRRRGGLAGLRRRGLPSAISAIRRPAPRRRRGRTAPSATSRAPPRPGPSGRRTRRATHCRRQAAPISLANRPGVGTMCGRSVSGSAISSMSKYRAPGMCAREELGVPVLGFVRQVLRRVEHHEVRLAEFPGQPVGRHQRFHASPRSCGRASLRGRGGKSIQSGGAAPGSCTAPFSVGIASSPRSPNHERDAPPYHA